MNTRSKLDIAAFAVAGVAVAFLAVAIRAPFFHAAVVGSALLAVRAQLGRRKDLFVIAGLLPPLVLVNALGNAAIVRLTPHTIDAILLSTDFGMSHAVFAWFQFHPAAFAIIHAVYYWLPLWGAVVLCFTEDARRAATVMGLAPLAALPIFLLLPATGPVWIHTATAPRNAFPSLHMTWALLLWYYSPRWLKPVSLALALITAAATLGLGEHYVIDLVAAFPFALAVAFGVERWATEAAPVTY